MVQRQIGFPEFQTWCETVLHPEDTHPWNFRTPEFYEEYKLKYAIAKMIRPTSILEIGVRFGYSAYSFLLASPHAVYMGLDKDEPSWGPYKGVPRVWAQDHLRARFDTHIDTRNWDTQRDPLPAFIPYDMVHIDADHSYKGALNDMKNFWPSCRHVMVVDDVAEIREVADAVGMFLATTSSAMLCGMPTAMRGAALIVREDV